MRLKYISRGSLSSCELIGVTSDNGNQRLWTGQKHGWDTWMHGWAWIWAVIATLFVCGSLMNVIHTYMHTCIHGWEWSLWTCDRSKIFRANWILNDSNGIPDSLETICDVVAMQPPPQTSPLGLREFPGSKRFPAFCFLGHFNEGVWPPEVLT